MSGTTGTGAGVPAGKAGHNAPRKTFPGPDPRALRELLTRSLSTLGLTGSQTTDAGDLAGPANVELPPDEPPEIEAPGPRQAPASVQVSARLIARLRRDYGRGVISDDGRRIGDLAEVAEWLEGLRPGQVSPGGPAG